MDNKIIEKIKFLKKKLNVTIIAHNYQLPEIQDIADYTGDSLGLSIRASKTEKDIIVFCGVYFMAETAKILSPGKIVLIPERKAGCPMADMIDVEKLNKIKEKNPNAKVMCYVNSTAKIKAESDICCTSSNAKLIAQKAFNENDKIIFIPDKYLAQYTASKVNRNFIFWEGYCPTHVKILPEIISKQMEKYPKAEVLVHPESPVATSDLNIKVFSTSGMSKYVSKSKCMEFIIGTENGMIYRLQQDNPGKKFYSVSNNIICPNMKSINLEKLLYALEEQQHEILIDENIMKKAQKSINEMMKYIPQE